MVYTRNPTWQNSPSVATPITAAALENIEAGLVNAANVADSSITALANKEPAISRTGATTGQVATLQAGGGLAFATPAAGGGTVAAATTTTQGIVQLAGDLAGTAAAPTVPALSTKLSSTDPSVTNARTPLAHKASHATGGADLLLPSDIGAATSAALTAETTRATTAEGNNATATATKAPLLTPTVVKTTAYTAVSGDLVRADATTASFAVTLPAATVGGVLAVKKVDSSVNTVTITPAGTDTIDGLTTAVLRLPNATQRLIAIVGGWVVADGFNALTALDGRYDAAGLAATRELLVSRTGATTGQVPVLQAGGTLAFATVAGGGGGSTTLIAAASQYLRPTNIITQTAAGSSDATQIRFCPIVVNAAMTIDTVTVEVTTAGGAGSTLRMGLYASDAYNRPAALLNDLGVFDATTTGLKTGTLAAARVFGSVPTLVWVGVIGSTGLPVRSMSSNAMAVNAAPLVTNVITDDLIYSTGQVLANPMPATVTPTQLANTGNYVPLVWLHRSA